MKQPEALVLLLCVIMAMVGMGLAKSHAPREPSVNGIQEHAPWSIAPSNTPWQNQPIRSPSARMLD